MIIKTKIIILILMKIIKQVTIKMAHTFISKIRIMEIYLIIINKIQIMWQNRLNKINTAPSNNKIYSNNNNLITNKIKTVLLPWNSLKKFE